MADSSAASSPEDPSPPFDWAGRYAEQNTPWDLGAAHPEFQARRDGSALDPARGRGRALVPGCGRGHDAVYLARLGFRVVAVDRVAELAAELGPRLAPLGGEYRVTDALAFDGSSERPEEQGGFDLILDHTFFCAIDPTERRNWAQLVTRNLAPGGRLVTLAFPADKPWTEGGPPWRTCREEFESYLGPGWQVLEDEPLKAPLARRTWEERWLVFERAVSESAPTPAASNL